MDHFFAEPESQKPERIFTITQITLSEANGNIFIRNTNRLNLLTALHIALKDIILSHGREEQLTYPLTIKVKQILTTKPNTFQWDPLNPEG